MGFSSAFKGLKKQQDSSQICPWIWYRQFV